MAKKKEEKPVEPKGNEGLKLNEAPPAEETSAEVSPIEEEAPSAEETPAEKDGSDTDQESIQDESQDDSELNHEDQQSGVIKKRVAIVIPYLKSKAQGSELLYAIRSIEKNFIESDYQLVVIGDKEDWFGSEILYIEHDCIGSNPQADVLNKLMMVLINEKVCDEFIWSNDDIYFISPTSLEDIQVLKTLGTLKKEPNNQTLYNVNRSQTIDRLLSKQLPIRNFDTHLPFFFEKEKMLEVIEAFPQMMTEGLLMASMYFNFHVDTETEKLDWSSDKWMLRVISNLATEEKKQTFRRLIGNKHFLNHSEAGFSKLLMDWISKQFPEKSRFEK